VGNPSVRMRRFRSLGREQLVVGGEHAADVCHPILAGGLDVRSSGVEVGVVGYNVAGPAEHRKENPLGGATLMGWEYVAKAEEDSSPRITAAHCSEPMADVPLSVRRSISTSSARRRKTLNPAARALRRARPP
jgi:hypothetical protein